ncbi:two-component regulator propeller domain-containing protein [Galbibacter sp. PAP.153]|uniref:two-component regulator propeller domain-containing protein n=1 Tax=Galbibacter sp. PAP.153 TaxID=3104623 RepID=UPI003009714E
MINTLTRTCTFMYKSALKLFFKAKGHAKGWHLCFLLICLQLPAQTAKFYSTDNKLSSTLINQVLEDKEGLIWVATEDGLNRYDGAKFKTYKFSTKDSTSILNNYVRCMYQTLNGQLLFGFFNGLQQYNTGTQSFSEIDLFDKQGSKEHCHVSSILERKNGELLIATSGSGIFKLHNENGVVAGRLAVEVVKSEFIQKLFEDKQRNLWVITQDKGVYCIAENGTISRYFYKNESEANISSICQAPNGNIYIGKLNEGLYKFEPKSKSFKKIPYTQCHLSIKTLYVNSPDEIYIGTDSSGMKVFNPYTETFSDVSLGINKFDFSKTKVHSIIKDRSHNLWLGIYQKGVALIPHKPNNFKYIGYQSINNNTIGSNSVMAIHEDRSNNLWVGTDGDGVYGLDNAGNLKKHYLNKEVTTIMSIYEDSNNTVWVGSYLNGIASLNKSTGEFNFNYEIKDENSHKVERIYSITEDGNKTLWIGSMGSGLFSLDLETGKIKDRNTGATIGLSYNPNNKMQNFWINTLLYSKENKLYIGTYNGLSCLDLETNSFIFSDGLNRVLAHKIIYSLYEDAEGNLWIGTSEGIFLKPKNSWKLENFSTKDGLSSNVVCAIKGDGQNNLWISTHHGISKFNKASQQFTNFYFNDGLQGNEFSKGAVTYDDQNAIYFGGINGITYFKPEQIIDEGKIPDIRLTACYLQNKEITTATKSNGRAIIEKDIMKADTLFLSHKDNTFNLEFAATNFIEPQRLTYFYNLNGKEWVSLQQGSNMLTFNDLVPGTYSLRVKAKEFKSFSPVKNFTIIVRPPWFLSLWAKICYTIIVVLITWAIYNQIHQRYKIKEKIRLQQYENQINEAKIQFFTNISHEIKTPMSLITNPLKKMMKSDIDPDRQKAYRIMHRNSERILHLINQLMEMRKIDKGQIDLKYQKVEMVSLIKDICFLFEDQKKAKEINLEFHNDQEELYAAIDPNYFDKTIQNILSNAFKFTPNGGHIKINLESVVNEAGKKCFKITVKDNGKGIDEHAIEKIFDRFYRATQDEMHPKEGTGIGLHLTRSIVNLHNGKVYAENNKDQKGCSLIMEIPLEKANANVKELDHLPLTGPVAPKCYKPQPVLSLFNTNSVSNGEDAPCKGKHTILLIDDDAEIRNYLRRELSLKYHILEASNGKEAYGIILQEPLDLIISDVKMPEMDGVTLCRKLKKNINVNHIPLILLTAKSREQDNIIGLDIGADAYLSKPFNLEILKKTVQNIIHNREMLKNTYGGNQIPEDKLETIQIRSADEKLINRVTKLINENLDNPDLNVEMIAREIGISRVHLYRKLKELTNQSARDYVRNIRLKQAGDLLATKNLSISEVTYATGFSHVSKFSSSFKEFYGVSPKVYKDSHLKKEYINEHESMAS